MLYKFNSIISFIDIATLISLGLALYLAYSVFNSIASEKKRKEEKRKSRRSSLDDYDKVRSAAYKLENERQANSGIHQDEEVYIERAKRICEESDFFSLYKF